MTIRATLCYRVAMSLLPYVALAQVGPEDAQQFQSFIDMASQVNVVNETVGDPQAGGYTIKDYVERYVWEVVRRTKQRRLPLEQNWLEIQRMVVLQHDTNQKYRGRSNAYIPVYKRNRKTLVSQLSRGLFPSDEFLDVVDREQGETEQAKAAKEIVVYELEHSGMRQTIKAFLGQLVDFGVTCMKVFYRKDGIIKGRRANGAMDDGMTIDPDEGVQVSTRSMFNVVIYPEWAEGKREMQVEAERLEVPISYVQAMHGSKRWLNVDAALATGSGHNDEFDWVNQATLADVAGIPSTMELRGSDGSPVESVIVVEVWCRCRLPKNQYAPFENPDLPVPAKVVFVNGVAVEVRRNPFYHQSSPFVYARDNQVAGSFYSDGAGNATKDLQYLANDHANQTNDCMTYGMNPVALVNTNYFAGAMDSLRPGRTYRVRDVDKAIKFHTPPVEIVQYGQTHFMNIVAMGQDASGAPPVLQGAKGANTATSTQILQQNAQNPLQDAVEDIEADAMVPLAKMAWELSKQYRDVAFVRKLAGGDLVRFLPSEIDADLEFKFLSSSQAVNRQQRQQGLTVFTELATRLQPNLQAMGKMLNPEPILQRTWNDGLGFRGFDKVIIPIPMPGMPGQPGMPPGPPGMVPPGPGGSPAGPPPPVSAVPQGNVPGAENNDPVPGEGEAFADVRQGANQTAAPYGGLGGNTPY